MQHISPIPPPLIENCQILPMSTTTISDISKPNDSQYTSLLLKKKLAIFENASKNPTTDVSISNDTMNNPVSVSCFVFLFNGKKRSQQRLNQNIFS